MNKLDKQYTDLLKDILENGTTKKDRTGTGTVSVFGRQIRHKMSDGFPVLTTKKMYMKGIITELIWFLNGRTDLRYLLENNCNIWVGDAYKKYKKYAGSLEQPNYDVHIEDIKENKVRILNEKEFIERIKLDDEFNNKFGDLGPIYGKQWRRWKGKEGIINEKSETGIRIIKWSQIDQIQNLINDLKTNPDSRRLIVSAWNVADLDDMILPPCHNFFQFYTRELSFHERYNLLKEKTKKNPLKYSDENGGYSEHIQKPVLKWMEIENIPTRTISLMWNQRSVDTPLGLPFNITSYGLLLEIIAKMVNMVPDELIGNLGDCHIYNNQIEGVKEQIGRDLTIKERMDWWFENHKPNRDVCDYVDALSDGYKDNYLNNNILVNGRVPKRTREPFELPKLLHLKTDEFCKALSDDLSLFSHLDPNDFKLENYQSHPTINFPLSN